MKGLLTLSGTRLAGLIRSGEATSREILEAHLARIVEVNPVLNAVVKARFEEARAEADLADGRLRRDGPAGLPPFHGVPCTIKECFALKGMPCTSGLRSRRDVVPRRDATAVARLRAAGAIPMGVTNVSELCLWMESDNRLYGRTNNPYDPSRTVGGSSGGEGAVIAAGGSPFGLGSDIGGSIRMPAFFNGIFGHKPTGGLVPNTGQFPTSRNLPYRMLTTGPLARRAEDLWTLLRILAGPDGEDPSCAAAPLGDPGRVDIAGMDVCVIEDNGIMDVHRDLRRALRDCAGHLAARGAKVGWTSVEGLKHSFDIWSAMLAQGEKQSMKSLMGGGRPINPLAELVRWAAGRSDHTLPAISLALFESVPRLMPRRVERFVEAGLDLRGRLLDLLGPGGVILYPPYVAPAPLHRRPMFPPFHWVYTGIFNAMEFPVTQVPTGLNAEGLPVGVQVVSAPGNDHVTVAVALELERAFGGWRFPGTRL